MIFAFLTICIVNLIFIFITFYKEQENLKRALAWECIVGGLPILGFFIYLICSNFFVTNKINLEKMFKEAEIYNKINSIEPDINSKNYSFNNNVIHFNSFEDYFNDILDKISKCNTYCLINLNELPELDFFSELCNLMIEKKKSGVVIKFSYEYAKFKHRKLLKQLQENKITPVKFSKIKSLTSRFKTDRDSIIVDGVIGFISPINAKKTDNTIYFAVEGNILNDLDYNAHRDYSFASKKFLPLIDNPKKVDKRLKAKLVTSFATTNYEFELISNFARAKKRIRICSDDFIVSDRIMQTLITALNLDVKVEIMISKQGNKLHFYASKYCLKKLCMHGAICYVYDGKIKGSRIAIDDEAVVITSTKCYDKDMEYKIVEAVFAFDDNLNDLFNEKYELDKENSYKMSKFRIGLKENFARFVLPLL